MSKNYEIDKIDRQILAELQKDSRIAYEEIARKLIVSGGTIHVRINKLKEKGIIVGNKAVIDYEKLGYDVMAFIGVNLHEANSYKSVLEKLKKFPEIIEIHYTTGKYNLFIKILVTNIKALQLFLIDKLQSIKEINSTETLISLDKPVTKDVSIIE